MQESVSKMTSTSGAAPLALANVQSVASMFFELGPRLMVDLPVLEGIAGCSEDEIASLGEGERGVLAEHLTECVNVINLAENLYGENGTLSWWHQEHFGHPCRGRRPLELLRARQGVRDVHHYLKSAYLNRSR